MCWVIGFDIFYVLLKFEYWYLFDVDCVFDVIDMLYWEDV